MEETKKVLYISSEIFPYMPETQISTLGRFLPQGIQESGKEIRAFMPRYGCINERRNQLHEVIRLSGMNLVVNDVDRPLIIKVSSISSARMQVYFIDNEDYFRRKQIAVDTDGKFFKDNDERAIFFARGVLETVKKLRWKPDIVHCQGWISFFVPFLMKKVYNEDPIFSESKIVISLHNEFLDEQFDKKVAAKLNGCNLSKDDIKLLESVDGTKLAEFAIRYADGIIQGEEKLDPSLENFVQASKIPFMGYKPANPNDFSYVPDYNNFYDKIIARND